MLQDRDEPERFVRRADGDKKQRAAIGERRETTMGAHEAIHPEHVADLGRAVLRLEHGLAHERHHVSHGGYPRRLHASQRTRTAHVVAARALR
ncbi:MAG: hypothetical protein NT062_02685 [Proteobacteria bacterium]|nr:hypothetical protein [Pseudomonadota bacterium]